MTRRADTCSSVRTVLLAIGLTLALATSAAAAERPRYDVPRGYTKCSRVEAWNGFFKWASVRHTSCRRAQRFLRAYATAADARADLPRRLGDFTCTIRYWRDAEGDVY